MHYSFAMKFNKDFRVKIHFNNLLKHYRMQKLFDISTIDSKAGLEGNFKSNDIPKMLYTATD